MSISIKKVAIIVILSLIYAPVIALDVVATIKPLHSLVQAVLGDSAQAKLLLDSNASPHQVQLKPSDVRSLNTANVVFMIDPSFEGFMRSIIESAPTELIIIKLGQNDAIKHLPTRQHKHENHSDKQHNDFDPHLWLSPENAKTIVRIIANQLAEINTSNASLYHKNLDKTLARLDQLDDDLKHQLYGFENLAYITQHDAYQYFEVQYKLNFIKAIALDSSIPPSVKLALNIQESIKSHNVRCIFREPQFSERMVNSFANNAGINTSILDPIGVDLAPGEDLYFDLMKNLANNFTKCLTQGA